MSIYTRGTRGVLKAALANIAPRSLYIALNAYVAARDIGSKRRWAPEIDFLPRFVKPGDTVVDVGANHGLYTFHLSHLVGSTGQVHAFEPMPPNLRILRHTIKRHRLTNVVVHRQACGDKPERATFCAPLDHGVPELGGGHRGSDGLTFDCEIVRLDDVVTGRIPFLKIDAEGAELLVLRGAQQILRDSRPIVQFEAGDHTSHYEYAQQDVFDFLSSFGYRFCNGRMEARACFAEAIDYFAFPH